MDEPCAETQERNECHTCRALRCRARPTHGDIQHIAGPEGEPSPQCGVEQAVGIEIDELRQQTAEIVIGGGLDGHAREAEKVRQIVGLSVRLVTTASDRRHRLSGPRTGPRRARLDSAQPAIGRTTSACTVSMPPCHSAWRKTETAALNEARHADRHAAAALDIATPCHHRVIGIHPHCARLYGYGGSGEHARLPDERIMHGDGAHGPGPDQQRIRRVGGALIGMAAALHRQAQLVGAGEIHRRDHVFGPCAATA